MYDVQVSPCISFVFLFLAQGALAETIPVTEENFTQAETAWNFSNWAGKGADKGMLHLREVTPVGPEVPTVRMNWDTLYSVQIVNVPDDGSFTISLPESDLYVAAQVIDEGGFSPYYLVDTENHEVSVSTDFALIIFRTELKDRTDATSLAHLHDVQDKIAISGIEQDNTYVPREFDQAQLEALRKQYKEEFLSAGVDYTYAKSAGEAFQHILNLSHAAGWGGYPPELGVSSAYSSFGALSGDECLAVSFDDPHNAFFTSFTSL